MSTSIIVVSYRRHDWLRRSIESALREADDVVVVDNGSEGQVAEVAEGLGARCVRLDRNHGFTGGVNRGARVATGDVLALLNDDAVAEPGWLESASVELKEPSVGVVAPKLVFARPFALVRLDDEPRHAPGDPRSLGRAVRTLTVGGRDLLAAAIGPGIHRLEGGELDGRTGPWRWTTGDAPFLVPLEHADELADLMLDGEPPDAAEAVTVINAAGTYLSSHGYGGDHGFGSVDDGSFDEPAERFGACGAALVTTRDVWETTGELADSYFAYYEDLDWCWRLRLGGRRVRYQPSGVVRHVGGLTSGGPGDVGVRTLAERNRLLTLARNAPEHVVVSELRRTRPARPVVQAVAGAVVGRRRLQPSWRRTAAAVWREWAGRDERWPFSAPS